MFLVITKKGYVTVAHIHQGEFKSWVWSA